MIKALNKINSLLIFRIIYYANFARTFKKEIAMKKVIENDPCITKNPVRNPIFLVGLPRTGTTLLHKLLHLDPRLKIPLNYELMYFPMYQNCKKEEDPIYKVIIQ